MDKGKQGGRCGTELNTKKLLITKEGKPFQLHLLQGLLCLLVVMSLRTTSIQTASLLSSGKSAMVEGSPCDLPCGVLSGQCDQHEGSENCKPSSKSTNCQKFVSKPPIPTAPFYSQFTYSTRSYSLNSLSHFQCSRNTGSFIYINFSQFYNTNA